MVVHMLWEKENDEIDAVDHKRTQKWMDEASSQPSRMQGKELLELQSSSSKLSILARLTTISLRVYLLVQKVGMPITSYIWI